MKLLSKERQEYLLGAPCGDLLSYLSKDRQRDLKCSFKLKSHLKELISSDYLKKWQIDSLNNIVQESHKKGQSDLAVTFYIENFYRHLKYYYWQNGYDV